MNNSENLSPSARPSLFKTLEQVMNQVEYYCFADLRLMRIDPFYKELCFVVADVLVQDPDSVISINGTKMSASLIQEVYGQLCHNHLQLVFDNFKSVCHRVYNKKSYLRTALYNAVFEIESHSINDMLCDRYPN